MALVQCACGCGTWIEDNDKCGRQRRFKKGHNSREKHLSEETKKKIGEANKNPPEEKRKKLSAARKGKSLSIETKEKISKSLQGKVKTEATRKKLSESLRGENNPMYGKTGKQNPFFGKHHSKKTRDKWSKIRKGRRVSRNPKLDDKDWLYQKYWIEGLNPRQIGEEVNCSITTVRVALKNANIRMRTASEAAMGERNSNYGKPVSEERRKLTSKQFKGKHKSEDTRKRIADAKKGEKNPNYGKPMSDKRKKEISRYNKKAMKELWKDPKYIKNVMRGLHAKPNKVEKKVDAILQKIFTDEWKYNGDFSCGIVIDGMIPDFVNINGIKAVIEVFGDVYHDPDKAFVEVDWKRQEFGRISTYAQFGYRCVILWEHDLKDDNVEEFVVNTVRRELYD